MKTKQILWLIVAVALFAVTGFVGVQSAIAANEQAANLSEQLGSLFSGELNSLLYGEEVYFEFPEENFVARVNVDGTIMDFRVPKPVGRDLDLSNPLIAGQDGYDHDWEAFCNPCAILSDPDSGRTMSVYTDCPAIHMYDGGCLADELGKDGAVYSARSGVALETQYYPDALNKPHWAQPVTKAGQRYHSVTEFHFT